MAVTVQDLLRVGGEGLKRARTGAVQWFTRETRKIRRANSEKGEARSRTGVATQGPELVGQIIMFGYDPKHKDTLPYYDRYPVAIPLAVESGSMLALNLHYLPPLVRLSFVRALESLAVETNPGRRLKISYNIVKSARHLGDYAPCIKRYLTSHVTSQVIRVDDREWEHAVLLPVARFVGATESQVWSDSLSGRKPKRREKSSSGTTKKQTVRKRSGR